MIHEADPLDRITKPFSRTQPRPVTTIPFSRQREKETWEKRGSSSEREGDGVVLKGKRVSE